MPVALTVTQLVDGPGRALQLAWCVHPPAETSLAPRPAHGRFDNLVGYLNPVRPCELTVMGGRELDYWRGLGSEAAEALFHTLSAAPVAAVIVADGAAVPERLARQSRLAVLTTPRPAAAVVEGLGETLPPLLCAATVIHGVLMSVEGMGVLLCGPPGSGKSETALALLQRRHHLVADDAPLFWRAGEGPVHGRCPERLWGFLEVRSLGLVNVPAQFGLAALRPQADLDLVVRLGLAGDLTAEERLSGARDHVEFLGRKLPRATLQRSAGRDNATLVEAVVRNHRLQCCTAPCNAPAALPIDKEGWP